MAIVTVIVIVNVNVVLIVFVFVFVFVIIFCFVFVTLFYFMFGFALICFFCVFALFCLGFYIKLLLLQVKDTADSRLQAGITASPETQKKLTGIMSKVSANKKIVNYHVKLKSIIQRTVTF